MSKLFQNSDVIVLRDRDFQISPVVKLISPEFQGHDGYIMAFISWCPHCQDKETFWSCLATEFNTNPLNKKEHFRIGIIDCEDKDSQSICQALGITGIPRFFHVLNDPKHPQKSNLADYQGQQSVEAMLGAVCALSATDNLCHFDPASLAKSI